MAYFTQEQIDKAKEIDVLSYLQNKNPDELVYTGFQEELEGLQH